MRLFLQSLILRPLATLLEAICQPHIRSMMFDDMND